MSKLQPPGTTQLDKHVGTDFLPLYTATVRVSGSDAIRHNGTEIARCDDRNLDVQLHLAQPWSGSGGGANPEQLFAAGYAACFHGALRLLAERAKVAIHDAQVVASVTFGRDPVDGLFALTADIRIHLPGVDRAIAGELVRNTERICPYTKMTKAGIECVVLLA